MKIKTIDDSCQLMENVKKSLRELGKKNNFIKFDELLLLF